MIFELTIYDKVVSDMSDNVRKEMRSDVLCRTLRRPARSDSIPYDRTPRNYLPVLEPQMHPWEYLTLL